MQCEQVDLELINVNKTSNLVASYLLMCFLLIAVQRLSVCAVKTPGFTCSSNLTTSEPFTLAVSLISQLGRCLIARFVGVLLLFERRFCNTLRLSTPGCIVDGATGRSLAEARSGSILRTLYSVQHGVPNSCARGSELPSAEDIDKRTKTVQDGGVDRVFGNADLLIQHAVDDDGL